VLNLPQWASWGLPAAIHGTREDSPDWSQLVQIEMRQKLFWTRMGNADVAGRSDDASDLARRGRHSAGGAGVPAAN
jgi:hypothetical protein